MSLLQPLRLEATYLRIIDETVAAASSFQSPAVLEELKQRWIEKFNARLRSQYHGGTSGTTERREETLTLGQATSCESKTGYNTTQSGLTDFTKESHGDTPQKCTHDGQDIEAHHSQKHGVLESKALESREDDDWDSTEWEPAESRNDQGIPNTEAQILDETTAGDVCREKYNPPTYQETSQSTISFPTKDRSAIVQLERGVVVDSERDLYDDLDEVDENNLSDLEDSDPAYSDVVVAQFESIQRPHARKPYRRGQWKLKLRRGVLQINGQEMLFNTMTGDLTF